MKAPKMLLESMKRLYQSKRFTEERMRESVDKGTIDTEDFEYITGVPFEAPAEETPTTSTPKLKVASK